MGVLHPFPEARAARLAGMLLNRHSPQEIADAVEILIDVLDTLGGEPDLEEGGDDEPGNGDDKDLAWPEWNQRDPYRRASGVEMTSTGGGVFGMTEDDEPDDHAEEDDPSGQCDEDGINTGSNVFWQHGESFAGPGCVISDDGY